MSCSNYLASRQVDNLKNSDNVSEVSESTTSGFNSNWGSREDLRDFVTKHGFKDISELYHERFKVDRQKLQQMLNESDEALVPADVFFAKIMEETDTYITWPTKLKLGAKSKKDPHVRIAGWKENVQAAKERIMSILYARSNRVTMKMDISYTDHSHIIGRGGLTIKRVMDETNCHVHFPDSNRSNATDKSNQVSISGDLDGVENARSRVRELLPLVFGFEPPIMSQNIDNTCPYVIKIQEQYKVQVMFKTRSKLHAIIVLVKGVEWEVEQVKQATILLMDYICNTLASQTPVQMSIQISPQHHPIILGKNHSNLKAIMAYTKCQIMFPDAQDQNIPNLKKSNISISGNIHNVYLARQLLIGSLPLVIIFDLPEENYGQGGVTTQLRIRTEQLMEIQNQCQVSVNIRQKIKQSIKSCVIKGVEKHATNIYKARNMILGLDDPPITAIIPPSYHLPIDSTATSNLSTSSCASASAASIPFSPNNHDLLKTPTNIPISPMFNSFFAWPYQANANTPIQLSAPPPTPSSAAPFVGILKRQNQFTFMEPSTVLASAQEKLQQQQQMANHSTLSNLSSISSGSSNDNLVFLPPPPPNKSATSDYQSMTNDKKSSDSVFFDSNTTCNNAKRLQGLKAMQNAANSINPDSYRVPNSSWSGYGLSCTSPAGFGMQNQSNEAKTNDDIWRCNSFTPFSSPSPTLNSSDCLDNTYIIQKLSQGKWTDMTSLLNILGMEQYVNLFAKNEVDLPIFATFNEQDLVAIGVTAFGSRRKMLLAIAELNRRTGMFAAAPGAERKPHLSL